MAVMLLWSHLCLSLGFMGSLVSMRWMESDAGGLSNGDGYISNVKRKQVFTQTGML